MNRKRRRPIHLHVMVSEEKLALLQEHMAEAGVHNMGAFVRKITLTGMCSTLTWGRYGSWCLSSDGAPTTSTKWQAM